MGNEFNKTEADFVYERYNKMREVSAEQDIPLEELPVQEKPVDWDGVVDDGSDPALVGDPLLAADIDLNTPEPALGRRADRVTSLTSPPPSERDEVLESDAVFAAEAAGLSGTAIDYADDEELMDDEEEELPLEDVPDADDIEPGTAIDPVSPPIDVMPGTDVLNGSNGEEE
ncbi:hypothetical protein [Paenibacillus sp. sgz5001063]|uniref:hypothetical protein n=1 Tax=Paenibacillus sp. sgz5001063 TaxID=3242474 RepID=UPI0036D3C102